MDEIGEMVGTVITTLQERLEKRWIGLASRQPNPGNWDKLFRYLTATHRAANQGLLC